ncbi:hypothetical protein S245_031518 [Arachis hypogaea]
MQSTSSVSHKHFKLSEKRRSEDEDIINGGTINNGVNFGFSASWLHGGAAAEMQDRRFVAVQAGRDTAKSSAAVGSLLLGAVKGRLVEMSLPIQGISIVAIDGD